LNQIGGNKCKKKSNIELLTTSPHIVSAPEEVCLDKKEPTNLGSIYPIDLDKPDVPDKESPLNINNLYKQINENFKIIIFDMIIKEEKQNCWAWWVFPTEMSGEGEPLPKTYVTIKDAHFLFKSKRFIFIHEKIYELFLKKEKDNVTHINIRDSTFPKIDHGRIYFFIEFWRNNIQGKPDWFNTYLSILAKYYLKPKSQ
jgi:hypothetical protein